jgi:hypothetical protein
MLLVYLSSQVATINDSLRNLDFTLELEGTTLRKIKKEMEGQYENNK